MKTVNFILTLIGVFTLSILVHEIYHWFTVKEPTDLCIGLTNGSYFGYIRSGDNRNTSEFVAYLIQFVILSLGFSLVRREVGQIRKNKKDA